MKKKVPTYRKVGQLRHSLKKGKDLKYKLKLSSDCCTCNRSRCSFQQQNYSPSRFQEIHTCKTLCSASSPVITSTLSNRIFSTGLEIQAAADSISVAFLNKALSVGKKKKNNEILSMQGIFWEYFQDNETSTQDVTSVIPVVSDIVQCY